MTTLTAAAIAAFIADALTAVGLPKPDADETAALMTEADLTGADAHGIFRLPQYVRRIRAGGINPRPDIGVTQTAAATAMVDGDNGMGHLVMAKAAKTAVALAREAGMGWVGAHHSNHAGSAGVYAALTLPHDMIGVYSVVASANHMAPWGGTDLLLGTNPIAFAIPAGEEAPVVLDIATSVVSYGTVKAHKLQHKPMPDGWMIDKAQGAPLTDPARSGDGLLLPVGGYKGSGLAIVLGLLAGPLNGAAFGGDVVDFNVDQESVSNTGHVILALDVSRFGPLAQFKAEVDRHIRDLRGSAALTGFDAIRIPGAERARRRAERSRDGVALVPELIAQLHDLAKDLGVTPITDR